MDRHYSEHADGPIRVHRAPPAPSAPASPLPRHLVGADAYAEVKSDLAVLRAERDKECRKP